MELLIRGTLYVSNRQFSTIIIRLKGYYQIERLEGLTLRMCSSNTLQTSRKGKAGLGIKRNFRLQLLHAPSFNQPLEIQKATNL
jgi:hypothetical protein